MKILSKLPNQIPLCLLNKEYIDFHTINQLHDVNTTLSDFPALFIPLKDKTEGVRVYYNSGYMYMYKGILYQEYHGIIIIIYKDLIDNQIKAQMNHDYLFSHPSHKTLLNKFAKFYGVNVRKGITISSSTAINKFFRTWTPSMKDYESEEQLKQSMNFLKFKKWQIPLMKE